MRGSDYTLMSYCPSFKYQVPDICVQASGMNFLDLSQEFPARINVLQILRPKRTSQSLSRVLYSYNRTPISKITCIHLFLQVGMLLPRLEGAFVPHTLWGQSLKRSLRSQKPILVKLIGKTKTYHSGSARAEGRGLSNPAQNHPRADRSTGAIGTGQGYCEQVAGGGLSCDLVM